MPPINIPIVEIYNPKFAELYYKALKKELKTYEQKREKCYQDIFDTKKKNDTIELDISKRRYENILDNIQEIECQMAIIELNTNIKEK